MSCTVIIIGNQANNRIPEPIISGLPPASVTACSPHCVISKAAVTYPSSSAPNDPSQHELTFDSTAPAKPAECYVLSFDGFDAAKSWLTQLPRQLLVGKTVLVLDPTE